MSDDIPSSSSPGATEASPAAKAAGRFALRGWFGGLLCVAGGGALSAALMSLPPRQDAAAEPTTASAPADTPTESKAEKAERKAAARAAVCANCGVVESVTAHKQEGKGTGLGAVTGGVVGGVVGHQMGGGKGKDALTVLGAVGGGFAGHEIEKRARSVTVHKVKVRMDDGSVRTITQSADAAVGARVRIEHQKLVVVNAAG